MPPRTDLSAPGRLVCLRGRGAHSGTHLCPPATQRNGSRSQNAHAEWAAAGAGYPSVRTRHSPRGRPWKSRTSSCTCFPRIVSSAKRNSGIVGRVGARFRSARCTGLVASEGGQDGDLSERGDRQPVFSFEPPGAMPALSGFPLNVHEFSATRWWHDLLFKESLPVRLDLPPCTVPNRRRDANSAWRPIVPPCPGPCCNSARTRDFSSSGCATFKRPCHRLS